MLLGTVFELAPEDTHCNNLSAATVIGSPKLIFAEASALRLGKLNYLPLSSWQLPPGTLRGSAEHVFPRRLYLGHVGMCAAR